MRGGLIAGLVVLLALGGFGALLVVNSDPNAEVRPIIPTEAITIEPTRPWQELLLIGAQNGTPVPTVALPDGQAFVAPTLPPLQAATSALIPANDIAALPPIDFPIDGATATPALPASNATTAPLATRLAQTPRPIPTNPPSLPVPLARDPRDHYWFARPIDPDRNNRTLNYYEYGTDGPADSPYPIHHGIDMPNEIGTTVRAAGSGLVIFATSQTTPIFQNSPSYGNVVVIEHDFSYQGLPLWTLYAHLEAPLVVAGERVEAGDAIALLGNTGQSGGPHVHFEVRLGQNTYGSTVNPSLWIAPFVNHGTIAGRVVDARGDFIDDAEITLFAGGVPRDVTTSYVFRGSGSQVNPDPQWNENFVFFDVPVGTYEVVVTLDGVRVSRPVTIREGLTTFVELSPPQQ
ncbi:MAG: peptidoglycan DD-metalloendopeptidase family protein [Anaerolineae bacterium]|jgi:murein DD-endopeptidase MepM/ murein hydrolase activator NlpD|nr:peptidoglycan DD-metalloendopeptidase family protein [Anaerolineae bacterium]